MKIKKMYRNEKGFTLVEIIAVLIILGILAAVAVPRYMSITTESKNKAAMAAVAEAKARVNQAAASYLLSNNGTIPNAADLAASDMGTDAGDFTITYGDSGTTAKTITATGVSGSPADGGSATGTAVLPTT